MYKHIKEQIFGVDNLSEFTITLNTLINSLSNDNKKEFISKLELECNSIAKIEITKLKSSLIHFQSQPEFIKHYYYNSKIKIEYLDKWINDQKKITYPITKNKKLIEDELWFITGLEFAKGNLSLNLKDYKGTYTDASIKIINNDKLRTFISCTLANDKSYNNKNKNIFYSKEKPEQILKYCNKHNIKVCYDFMFRYNKLEFE